MRKVHLIYFKESGKYYSEGDYESECLYEFQIYGEVRTMDSHPGLINPWHNGAILVEPEDGVPALVWRNDER